MQFTTAKQKRILALLHESGWTLTRKKHTYYAYYLYDAEGNCSYEESKRLGEKTIESMISKGLLDARDFKVTPAATKYAEALIELHEATKALAAENKVGTVTIAAPDETGNSDSRPSE